MRVVGCNAVKPSNDAGFTHNRPTTYNLTTK